MSTEDLAYLMSEATANWSIDYTEPDSDGNRKCFLVWKQASNLGYGSREFRAAVDRFIRRTTFPTWTVADFFAGKRTRVYGHAWYREQIAKGTANAEIGRYEIASVADDGTTQQHVVWGIRAECDGLLTPHVFAPTAAAAAAPAASTAPSDGQPDGEQLVGIPVDVQPEWKATKRLLEVEGQIDELTQQRNRAYRETEMHRQLLETTQAELREAHATILHLESEIARMKQSHVTAAVAP